MLVAIFAKKIHNPQLFIIVKVHSVYIGYIIKTQKIMSFKKQIRPVNMLGGIFNSICQFVECWMHINSHFENCN